MINFESLLTTFAASSIFWAAGAASSIKNWPLKTNPQNQVKHVRIPDTHGTIGVFHPWNFFFDEREKTKLSNSLFLLFFNRCDKLLLLRLVLKQTHSIISNGLNFVFCIFDFFFCWNGLTKSFQLVHYNYLAFFTSS